MLSSIVPHEVIEEYKDLTDWKNSCGTGPFMVTDYVSGSVVTLERNPNYWMKDPFFPENQLPYVDGVKLLIITDASTRLAAVRTATIDWMGGYFCHVLWEDGDSLRKTNPELKYREVSQGICDAITFRVDKPELPIYDVRVRKALCMAVDHQEIFDTYFGGRGYLITHPAIDIPELKDVAWTLEELPVEVRKQFEYHPDEAKQLLAEAGYPNGFKTEIACRQVQADEISIVKDYWAKNLNVDLNIIVKEAGEFTTILYGKLHKEMLGDMFTGCAPFMFHYVRSGSAYNTSCIKDARVDADYEAISAAYFDWAKKCKIMKENILYQYTQVWNLQFPSPVKYMVWQPWVKGYSGELEVGRTHKSWAEKHCWIDQDLKEKMTGRR